MKKILLTFIMSCFLALAVNANTETNGMSKAKCDMPNCNMKKMKKDGSCGAGKCGGDMKKMKKSKCDMPNCNMKKMKKGGSCGAGKCGGDMKKMKKAKTDAKMCGCGMTQESCKKMMPSCEYRDEREAAESKK